MKELLKITAIEGASFSGKSTLIKELSEKYGIPFIGEYSDFANKGADFPKFPYNSLEDAKKSVKFFLEIEKKRSGKAINLALSQNLPIIMDRSPLSCIVFQRAVSILNPEQYSVYQYTIEQFHTSLSKEEIIIPPSIVYIKPPSFQEFNRRVNTRGATNLPILDDYRSGKLMELWYIKCIQECYDEQTSMLLDGGDSISKNANATLPFLTKSKDISSNTTLQSFQNLSSI